MASFSTFANRLPDPDFKITEQGDNDNSNGIAGPGFATVKFTSTAPTAVSRTNSGRVITRTIVNQRWSIGITYNPMTREEFEPVHNFLLDHGRLKPFFVALPQYKDTRDSDFTADIKVDGAQNAGAAFVVMDAFGDNNAATGLRPGYMITFNDSNNSNHKKAYKVTKVTNNTDYLAGSQPASGERHVYIHPRLEKDVSNNTDVVYVEPLVRVIMTSDVIEYTLGNNNLYQFSLNLEEAQP